MKQNTKNIFDFFAWGLFGIWVFGFWFLYSISTTHAQYTPEQTPAVPSAQEIADSLGLDQYSAPAVDIFVSASGVVGTSALLTAKTNNISDNASEFQWYLDDVYMPLQSGKAKTTFSFKTVKPFHIVRLVILENNKKVTENTVSINSFNVSLVWATDTFVPGDYEGKAMPVVGSVVTMMALPDIRGEDPENLLYTWYVNSESRVRSVANEQEFSFRVTKNVSFMPVVVEVSNASGSVMVRRAVSIPVTRPMVLIHQGKKDSGLSSDPVFVSPGGKINLYAKPFYFHIQSISNLSYEWRFISKRVVGIPPDPNFLLLSIPADSAGGAAMLRLFVINQQAPEQQATREMEITIL